MKTRRRLSLIKAHDFLSRTLVQYISQTEWNFFGTDWLMLRLRTSRLLQSQLSRGSNPPIASGTRTLASKESVLDSSLDIHVDKSSMDPLMRYLPSESQAFLVEDHRLTGSERASQKVSAVFPWMMLMIFAAAPFVIMKYNLNKLGHHVTEKVDDKKTFRHPFKAITFNELQDILQRRSMTLCNFYDNSFHSQILVLVFREIDNLFSKHGVDVGICAIPIESASEDFKTQHETVPVCQLVRPTDGTVVDFTDSWSTRSLVEFVLPPSRISPGMKKDIEEVESKLAEFRKCLFAKRFLDKKHSQWSVSDSVNSDSVDVALARCRAI